ncbi:glycosyl hydrolase [Paenibacillus spiritus]|uniref:glycosyl hydrolase n=1 Tax=Paenibacillus spiritus TaxID=2496557 RepID=UPI001CC52023|nr:glycosyl hydrolase [Paenibacillus spiritus]
MRTSRKYRLFTALLPAILLLVLLGRNEVTSKSAVPAAPSPSPVNANISPEAKRLYDYLVNLGGKGILSGQHDYLESPDEFNRKLRMYTGESAVIHGYELGAIGNQSTATIRKQRQAVVESAENWYKSGGIVVMTFHQNLPGTSPEWTNVHMTLDPDKFNAYITPGTAEYKNLIAELDDVAGYLEELRDEGVPVLWRPYHEMNGGWFWWGQKEQFSKLWDLMYERFTVTHGLNNLLWVWNPNAPNESSGAYKDYYPGADKVDILAADIYNNDFRQYYYDSLLELAGDKPIAIGENGELPDPGMLAKTQSRWVYMMTWGKMLTENNSSQAIRKFMSNPFTLSREDVKSATELIRNGAPAVAEKGLTAEYFNNATLSGKPVLTRKEQKLEHNWHTGSPAAGVSKDLFSIRWSGTIVSAKGGLYEIKASSDDGSRVKIGGTTVIDAWIKQSSKSRKGTIYLKPGQKYNLTVEYFENRGNASFSLTWKSAGQKESAAPSTISFVPR